LHDTYTLRPTPITRVFIAEELLPVRVSPIKPRPKKVK
jgi:hypothetical protein